MTEHSFVHLNVHSEYSLMDSLVRIEELVEMVARRQGTAVALTDHCNLFAMVKFYEAAIKEKIKPIIGCEVLIENENDEKKYYPLILLCMNETGFRNLTEIVSESFIQGQIGEKPLVKKPWLLKKNQGLIAIAPCQTSDIAESLKADNLELAETLVEYWGGLFPERFYLEITRFQKHDEDSFLKKLILLASQKECALVATNAVRFLNKSDFEAHEARVCIQEGITLNDPSRKNHYSEEQYLKTPSEMVQLWAELPEAIENANEIAKRCNLKLTLGQVYLPNYPVPQSLTIEEYLKEAAVTGLKQRFKNLAIPELYQNRLQTEIEVINSMGFAGYFLIVADFIRWALQNGVPVGPGRGSGAGSLVAYALNITGIDPIQYELLFERFLNPERVSMPDFDIDFCMEGRDRVIDYVATTYGRDSVSQIITFGTMAAKAVIRDVGRVLGHPYGFVDKIAKLIPLELGITLEKALQQEEVLKNRYEEEEEVKLLIDLAQKLEGITRNAGKHAGGVVIAPSKLTDYTPLYCDMREGVLLTQLDKNDVETIGLVKFDFLGLRTLTIIDWAAQTVNEQHKIAGEALLDINDIPLDDPKTFELLQACHTTAVFQLESRGMKDLVRRLRPDNFEEIIALVALFRPGPLQSGMVDDFINRKHGRAKPEYLHPKLVSILKPTYGIILYQEQVMQIAQILAGYTLGAADLLRRAMGKKKPEEMAKQRSIFLKGAMERGVQESTANTIFDLMEKFAAYGFNKSHSAAYAVLTYQTAWLKVHYPAAFMAAVLSSDMNHTDKVVIFIEDCRSLNIPVCPPNINQCAYKFTASRDGQIYYGLGAIKGVGEAAINHILEMRSKPFKNLFDFCARIDTRKVTRRTLDALIRSGAMDSLGTHRGELLGQLDEALQASQQLSKNRIEGQEDLFGDSFTSEDIASSSQKANFPPLSKQMIYMGEKETLGFYLSGHPLEEYESELQKLKTTAINALSLEKERKVTIAGLIVNIRTLLTKKGDKMAFITLEDRTARQEIAIFSDIYAKKRDKIVKDNLVIIEGEISPDEYSGGYKMRCMQLIDIIEARESRMKYLKIAVAEDKISENFTQKLMNTLKEARGGKIPVCLLYQKEESHSLLKLEKQWSITPHPQFIDNLKELCGDTAVELCYE